MLDFFTGANPAASVAEGAIKGVLGSVSDIIKIFKLPPEQQLLFEQKMAELEQHALDRVAAQEKVDAEDRNSARQREMAIRDKTPAILAFLIVAVFGAAQYMVFTHPFPSDQAIMVARVLGTIDMALGLVLGYYFGSSSSSRLKDVTLQALTTLKTPPK
mgnify:CR=1 FL=1